MNDGTELVYSYDTKGERTGITALLSDLNAAEYPLPGSADRRNRRWRISSSA